MHLNIQGDYFHESVIFLVHLCLLLNLLLLKKKNCILSKTGSIFDSYIKYLVIREKMKGFYYIQKRSLTVERITRYDTFPLVWQ